MFLRFSRYSGEEEEWRVGERSRGETRSIPKWSLFPSGLYFTFPLKVFPFWFWTLKYRTKREKNSPTKWKSKVWINTFKFRTTRPCPKLRISRSVGFRTFDFDVLIFMQPSIWRLLIFASHLRSSIYSCHQIFLSLIFTYLYWVKFPP